MRTAHGRELALVTEPGLGGVEYAILQMLDEVDGDHRLEHRYVDLLPFAGALAMQQSKQDRRSEDETYGFVRHRKGHKAGRAVHALGQAGDAACALNDIVESGPAVLAAVSAVTARTRIDQPWIDRLKCRVIDAQLAGRCTAHVMDKKIRPLDH